MVCVWCRESVEPVYSLLRDPVEGDLPTHLVMEVQLPGLVSLREREREGGRGRERNWWCRCPQDRYAWKLVKTDLN